MLSAEVSSVERKPVQERAHDKYCSNYGMFAIKSTSVGNSETFALQVIKQPLPEFRCVQLREL